MCTGPPWKNHKLSPATYFLSPPRTDNAQAGPPSCHLPLHCLRETGQEVQNKLDGSSPWENETGKRQQRSLAKACIWQMGMCTRYVTVSPKQLYFSNCSTTLVREMLSILIARMPVCEKPDQTWQSREKGGNESQAKYCSHTVTHWCLASEYLPRCSMQFGQVLKCKKIDLGMFNKGTFHFFNKFQSTVYDVLSTQSQSHKS